MTLGCKRRS